MIRNLIFKPPKCNGRPRFELLGGALALTLSFARAETVEAEELTIASDSVQKRMVVNAVLAGCYFGLLVLSFFLLRCLDYDIIFGCAKCCRKRKTTASTAKNCLIWLLVLVFLIPVGLAIAWLVSLT